jgi:hypothetical protein
MSVAPPIEKGEHATQVGTPDPEQSFELLREQVGDEAAACYFNGVQYGEGALVLSGSTYLRCERGIWVEAGAQVP